MSYYDIAVYGSGLGACCAAYAAKKVAPSKSVVMILPSHSLMVGGLATEGGQNYWDTNPFAEGTLSIIKNLCDYTYNTVELSDKLRALLIDNGVVLKEMYDFTSFTTSLSPYRITSITIKNIYRDGIGRMIYGSTIETITAAQFIDASEDGKMARVINSPVTTGRYDFPANCLDSLETSTDANNAFVSRQQATTLMIKMKNIDISEMLGSDMATEANNGRGYQIWGGKSAYEDNNGRIKAFNDQYKSEGYMIKSVNAAQDGAGSTEWWVNTFLIFNVDGRLLYRDRNNSEMYPSYSLPGSLTADDAWTQGRVFLSVHEAEILQALQTYPGFSHASFVYDTYGYPLVGEVPYIRETVHMPRWTSIRQHGSEKTDGSIIGNYGLLANQSFFAGSGINNGDDTANYNTRIGLGKYNADIHPYTPDDLIDNNGNYIWGPESFKKIRGDLAPGETVSYWASAPVNPAYLPYDMIKTEYVANLLIPGYATGCSAFSWGEMRILQTLCVLGDAAGVTAAYCVLNDQNPYNLSGTAISWIQNKLINTIHARLDK